MFRHGITIKIFEDYLFLIEDAELWRVIGSGMVAVFGAMARQLEAGGRVLASRALFKAY